MSDLDLTAALENLAAIIREHDDACAANAAVRALHRNDGGTCPTCLVGTTPFPQPAPWPCATYTLAALDVRHDPSATTDGGAG